MWDKWVTLGQVVDWKRMAALGGVAYGAGTVGYLEQGMTLGQGNDSGRKG